MRFSWSMEEAIKWCMTKKPRSHTAAARRYGVPLDELKREVKLRRRDKARGGS